jgi:hypothetical protein
LLLVRSSHHFAVAVLAILLSGCIFPEPPTWEGPQKTQPRLWNPTPQVEKFIPLSSGVSQIFTVSESSEDAGEALRAIWYLNGVFQNDRDYAPGHINDVKTINVFWPVYVATKECVPFTLLVMHVSDDSSNNSDGGILDHKPIDPNDASTITWWLNLNNSPNCPTGGGTTN